MNETSRKLVEKAEQSVEAANQLAMSGFTDFAISRAYYAMFYAAEAVLNERGLTFRRHGGVLAAFGEHLVKTGKVEARYHRWLIEAFSNRITGDYGVDALLTADDAEEMVRQAREFVEAMREYLEQRAHCQKDE